MSGSTNIDILSIGGGITAVGIAAQFPALSGAMTSLVSAFSPTIVGGTVELGVTIATALSSVVSAPVILAAGAAIVVYQLAKD